MEVEVSGNYKSHSRHFLFFLTATQNSSHNSRHDFTSMFILADKDNTSSEQNTRAFLDALYYLDCYVYVQSEKIDIL